MLREGTICPSQRRTKAYHSQQITVAKGSVFVLVPQAPTPTKRSKEDHTMLTQAMDCITGKEPQA